MLAQLLIKHAVIDTSNLQHLEKHATRSVARQAMAASVGLSCPNFVVVSVVITSCQVRHIRQYQCNTRIAQTLNENILFINPPIFFSLIPTIFSWEDKIISIVPPSFFDLVINSIEIGTSKATADKRFPTIYDLCRFSNFGVTFATLKREQYFVDLLYIYNRLSNYFSSETTNEVFKNFTVHVTNIPPIAR